MKPTLDEIMMSPGFTDAERAEYSALKAKHAGEIAEAQARIDELNQRHKAHCRDILGSAQRGERMPVELIEKALASLAALSGVNLNQIEGE